MSPSGSARSDILAALRASSTGTPDAPIVAAETLATSPTTTDSVALFVSRVSEYNATVLRVASSGIAAAISDLGLVSVATPVGLPYDWLPSSCDRRDDSADRPLSTSDLDDVDASVTGCRLAIASTGTIVLDGGRLSGRRLVTLWPDMHVCVVPAASIVAAVPQAVAGLDPVAGPLTWVSGPSATSDIEFRRVEGVHGPRRLVVLVVS